MSEPKHLESRRVRCIRCARIGLAGALAVASATPAARADSTSAMGVAARADALWTEGRTLRDGGQTSEACARFAQSNRLAPGVGVALDLADCYERLGHTASAWSAFSSVEKLAREQKDRRAEVAHAHAKALGAQLSLLTIAVSAETAATTTDVLLDRQVVPRETYNTAVATDPGDHVLSVVPRTGRTRTLTVHVLAHAGPLTVHAEDAQAPTPAADPKPAALLAPVTPVTPAPPAAASPADALFEEGKRLREAGKIEDACSKFAQSQALAPGVGITLHLADCYERLGRTASAWIEFTMAEKAAHAEKDKRETAATTRAAALEPRLERITIAVPAATPQDGSLVQLDGRTVPPAMWNVAMAADPGDHLVAFQAAGSERRTFPVHLDEAAPSVTVNVSNVSPPAAPAATTTAADSFAPASAPPANVDDHGASTRRWVEIGLLGGAVVAAGVGAGLLVVKNDSMSNTGADGRPYVDPVVTAASKIAFGAGGAAAAAAIVIYLTAPHPKDAGLYVRTTPTVGGASAILAGTF
jgi:hypothetical protein